jgi:serine/threonine-protein kinase SRPK3
MVSARFRPSRLDNVENIEDYKPTGFHPVVIGDTLAQDRYRIIHKLGFGGSSTIWLARNQTGKLVTLKVMRANVSLKPVDEIPELVVPRKVVDYIRAQDPVPSANMQIIEDHFIENGPNGSHFCFVSELAGPSILSMSDSPGRVIGSRRLRRDLARKVARQVVGVVELMHSAGFVHGGSCQLLGGGAVTPDINLT